MTILEIEFDGSNMKSLGEPRSSSNYSSPPMQGRTKLGESGVGSELMWTVSRFCNLGG